MALIFLAALATITTRMIVQAIVVLVILGVVLYLLETFVPMAAPFKTVLRVVVVLLLCLWILSFFGLLT